MLVDGPTGLSAIFFWLPQDRYVTLLMLQNTLGYDIRSLNIYLSSEISAELDLLFNASSTVDL